MILIYLELNFALEQLVAENHTYRCPTLRGCPANTSSPMAKPHPAGRCGRRSHLLCLNSPSAAKLNLSQPQLVLVANFCPAVCKEGTGALPAPAVQLFGHGRCVCGHQGGDVDRFAVP